MRRGALTFVFFAVFFAIFFLPAEGAKIMANGDAIYQSLPALLGKHRLWEPLLLLGYPLFGDPSQQHWYPLAWFVSSFDTFDAFAIAPFVIGAFAMYGFVRSVTGGATAAIAAAFVYALGGFMISHAGHLMITHPAAWAPCVFWGIEVYRKTGRPLALCGAAVALGLVAVSGQPTVLVFTLVLAAGYAIVSSRAPGFLARVALAGALGVGLGAIQLIPEIALGHESTRASLAFENYVHFEIPASQLAMRAVFPYALGVSTEPGFAFSRLDLGTFMEDTIAVGVVALVLALLASAWYARDRRIAFWSFAAFAALVLAIGDATPLATITHALPVFKLLRIPGRHAYEWVFAVAVLAGYGTQALLRGLVSWRRFGVAVGLAITCVAIGYAQFTIGAVSNASFVAQSSGADLALVTSPLHNGALGFPLVTALAGFVLLALAVLFARSRAAAAMVVLAVVFDVGSFAWPAYWNFAATDRSSLASPAFAKALSVRLHAQSTRIAWLPGYILPAVAPNLTQLWDVPSLDVYSPFVPQRATDLLGMNDAGGMLSPGANDPRFDVAGASLIAAPSVPAGTVSFAQPFASGNIHLFFSLRDPAARRHAELALSSPSSATGIALVSELGDSLAIAQGARVATISIVHADGSIERDPIRAGIETSEFAYDRPDVRANVHHARAHIFATFGPGHEYDATLPVRSTKPIRRVDIDWTSPLGAFTLEKLSLVDARAQTAHAFDSLAPLFAQPDHWRPVQIDPSFAAFENRDVLPRAWFARPIASDEPAALQALHSATLPSGEHFDAKREAMVEGTVPALGPPDASDTAHLDTDTASEVALTTTCAHPCFLVVRDAYDANWTASVDGTRVPIRPTDIALRGVVLDAGTHRVQFDFVPWSLYIGAIVTALCALATVVLGVLAARARFALGDAVDVADLA
jgi:hypothetical protein